MSKETKGTPNDDSTPTKIDKAAQPPDDATPTKSKSDTRTLMPTKEQEDADDEFAEVYYYPPAIARTEKISKETAEYKKGLPFHRCGICTYYQSSHCKVVRGYISPDMGCKYFQEKYDPSRFKLSFRTSR